MSVFLQKLRATIFLLLQHIYREKPVILKTWEKLTFGEEGRVLDAKLVVAGRGYYN